MRLTSTFWPLRFAFVFRPAHHLCAVFGANKSKRSLLLGTATNRGVVDLECTEELKPFDATAMVDLESSSPPPFGAAPRKPGLGVFVAFNAEMAEFKKMDSAATIDGASRE